MRLPSKLAIGSGIGETGKWLLGAEITLKNKGSLVNNYNDFDNVGYERFTKYTIGGFYKPNSKLFSSYFERIIYRAGLKYEKTGLIINAQSIIDKGFTLGLGLPITGTFSNINIGFELGKRGTTKANLVQEDYANLSISFSLNDKWFVKTKYN